MRRRLGILLIPLALGACRSKAPTEAAPAPSPAAKATPPLQYVERVLGRADPAQPLPLIVAMHGLGDRPEAFQRLYDGFDVPVRVVLPRAPHPWGEGAAWFTTRIRDRDPVALAQGMRAAADAVAALITRLEAKHPVMGKPIVTGFSQGGMVTLALAVEHPDRLGHALPIGGVLPPPLIPPAGKHPRYPPIRALHGRDDRIVPFGPADQGIRALREIGVDAAMVPFDRLGHSISPQMRKTYFQMLAKALERTTKTTTATVSR